MRDDGQGNGQEMLKALARKARREQTPAEARLWEPLRDHRCGGLHFRRQKVTRPFRLDFYCRQVCLAVEVDGSIHEEEDVKRRDADRQQILEQGAGIRFLRVTNEDVLQRPQQTLARILQAAQAQAAPPTASSPPLSHSRGESGAVAPGSVRSTGGGGLP